MRKPTETKILFFETQGHVARLVAHHITRGYWFACQRIEGEYEIEVDKNLDTDKLREKLSGIKFTTDE